MRFEGTDEISLIWGRIWKKCSDRLLDYKISYNNKHHHQIKMKINTTQIRFEPIEKDFEIPESLSML